MLRLTRQQVREVDRRAIAEYHIPGIVLMENAARAAADLACEMLEGNCACPILIFCGGGNNGGDGLAVARHLHNRGAAVALALTVDPRTYTGDAGINWRIARAMRLATVEPSAATIERLRPLLIIDAIFGTGLTQPPRDPFGQIAEGINHSRVPVLAIDLPSGLDCDTGRPLGEHCIRATRTISFVAEKAGFASPASRAWTGSVTVGDIGAPRELIEQAIAGPG